MLSNTSCEKRVNKAWLGVMYLRSYRKSVLHNNGYEVKSVLSMTAFKVVIHVEMPKAAPKKSICHFQKLEMILK